MSIYSKLSALLTAANTKTGESDTTLTDAVQTLIDGYGQGGGSSDADGLIDGSLLTLSNSNVTSLRNYAFANFSGIQSISLPNVTTVNGRENFVNASGLVTVNLPKITDTTAYMFYGCGNLQNVDISLVANIRNYAFRDCVNLEFLDLPTVGMIYGNGFNGCKKLVTLVLRKSTLCGLESTNVFTNTPFAGYNGLSGTVYVPSALISTYQGASNWSAMYSGGYCTFSAIEGSAYE